MDVNGQRKADEKRSEASESGEKKVEERNLERWRRMVIWEKAVWSCFEKSSFSL